MKKIILSPLLALALSAQVIGMKPEIPQENLKKFLNFLRTHTIEVSKLPSESGKPSTANDDSFKIDDLSGKALTLAESKELIIAANSFEKAILKEVSSNALTEDQLLSYAMVVKMAQNIHGLCSQFYVNFDPNELPMDQIYKSLGMKDFLRYEDLLRKSKKKDFSDRITFKEIPTPQLLEDVKVPHEEKKIVIAPWVCPCCAAKKLKSRHSHMHPRTSIVEAPDSYNNWLKTPQAAARMKKCDQFLKKHNLNFNTEEDFDRSIGFLVEKDQNYSTVAQMALAKFMSEAYASKKIPVTTAHCRHLTEVMKDLTGFLTKQINGFRSVTYDLDKGEAELTELQPEDLAEFEAGIISMGFFGNIAKDQKAQAFLKRKKITPKIISEYKSDSGESEAFDTSEQAESKTSFDEEPKPKATLMDSPSIQSDSPSPQKVMKKSKKKHPVKKKTALVFTEEELEQRREDSIAQYEQRERDQLEIRGLRNPKHNIMEQIDERLEEPAEQKEEIRSPSEIEEDYPQLQISPVQLSDLQAKYIDLLKIKVDKSDVLQELNNSLLHKEDGYQKIEGALLTVIEEYIAERGLLTKDQEEQYNYIINVSKVFPTPIREYLKGTTSGNIAFTITGENRLTCSFEYLDGPGKLPTLTIHCFGTHY